jgi:hypothetical protein
MPASAGYAVIVWVVIPANKIERRPKAAHAAYVEAKNKYHIMPE